MQNTLYYITFRKCSKKLKINEISANRYLKEESEIGKLDPKGVMKKAGQIGRILDCLGMVPKK